MRVNQGVVEPGLRGSKAALVQLSNGKNGVLNLATDGVAVNVELVGKAVVLAILLKLTERFAHQSWVGDSNVGGGFRVVS